MEIQEKLKFQDRSNLYHPISIEEMEVEPRVPLVLSHDFWFLHSNNSHNMFKYEHKLSLFSFSGNWAFPTLLLFG